MGVGGLGSGGIKPKRKRSHGHQQQCGDCGGREVGEGGGGHKADKQ